MIKPQIDRKASYCLCDPDGHVYSQPRSTSSGVIPHSESPLHSSDSSPGAPVSTIMTCEDKTKVDEELASKILPNASLKSVPAFKFNTLMNTSRLPDI